MPVVIVATMTAQPEKVDEVRAACLAAVAEVHNEPGCQLYSVHQNDNTFVFVEQWVDEDAVKTHSSAPAIGTLFGAIGGLLEGAPDIKMLTPLGGGDPAKGLLRG